MHKKTFLEELGGTICGRVGHSPQFVLPFQIRNDNTEILSRCRTCGEERWTTFKEGGYEKFIADIASGKISEKPTS